MLCVTQAVPAACEVLVAVAQHDSPEFRRQSQEYSQVSPAAPRPAPWGCCPGCPARTYSPSANLLRLGWWLLSAGEDASP